MGWEWCDGAVEWSVVRATAFFPLLIFIFQSDYELHEYSTLICSTVVLLYLTENFPLNTRRMASCNLS